MATLSPFTPAQIDLEAYTSDPQSSIRTLLDVIDHNAAVNGRYRFCIQAEKDSGGQNNANDIALRTVTHAELKDALLRSTRWFQSHHINNSERRPVALLMDSDLSLLLSLLSLVALGVPV